MNKKKLSLENLKVSSFITNPSGIRGGNFTMLCADLPATLARCYGGGTGQGTGDPATNNGQCNTNDTCNNCDPNTTAQTSDGNQSGVLAANC